jgi:hypothetical protein
VPIYPGHLSLSVVEWDATQGAKKFVVPHPVTADKNLALNPELPVSGGFRGEEKLNEYVFNKAIGFGHFELPPGTAVTVRNVKGSSTNLANVGNKLFASMNLKMMLDYRHRRMTFFGDCR